MTDENQERIVHEGDPVVSEPVPVEKIPVEEHGDQGQFREDASIEKEEER